MSHDSSTEPGTRTARDTIIKLALRPKDAATALSISERLLWTKTNAGEIPHVRIGKAVLYPISLLNEFLANEAKKAGGGR